MHPPVSNAIGGGKKELSLTTVMDKTSLILDIPADYNIILQTILIKLKFGME
jgi:hypothetical protein